MGRVLAMFLGTKVKVCGCYYSSTLLKRDYFNRKYIFQPLIFRGHSFVFRGVPAGGLLLFVCFFLWGGKHHMSVNTF